MSATSPVKSGSLLPSSFDDFFKPWNEWFGNSGLQTRTITIPAVNITENNNEYMVTLAAPGLRKEDFKIETEGNIMTIYSEKEETKEKKEEKFTRREYNYSSFSRSFNIPEDVDRSKIDASYKDGVLSILLPRKEEAKKSSSARQITVK